MILAVIVGSLILGMPVQAYAEPTTEETAETAEKEETVGKETTAAGEKKDVYGIGSISKMYTTTAVMKLVEEGKIDLDEPLVTYLPEFSMADERYVKITPRMLLNHTSGLMGTTTHDAFTFGTSDTRYHDSILEELKSQSLKADPGEYGVYCNDGFTLAELLIERVSGMGYSEYLDQNFFKPLGIEDTYTPVYQFDASRIAPAYLGDSELPYIDCHLIGSGGIYSTASDVAKFGQLFAGQNQGILSEEILNEMQESNSQKDSICYREGDKQFDYGLGWDCVDTYPYSAYGIKALSKGGSIIFQNSALVVLPEEHISASMIVSGGSGDDAGYALQDLILEILVEEGVIEETKDLKVETGIEPDVQPLPEEMKAYAGYYLSNGILQVTFAEDGTLCLENIEDEYDLVQEYAYIGDGRFAPLNGSYLGHSGELTYNSNGNQGYGTLYFETEQNGKTYLAGSAYESIYGLGENATSMAFAEKIEPAELDQKVLEQWKERDGKQYFLTNSVYNSWNYYTEGILELQCSRELEGYIHTDKMTDIALIRDGDHATGEADLPIMLGRDLAVYEFEQLENTEQMKVSTLNYISEDQVQPIEDIPEKLTMSEREETVWYSVGEEYANQSIQIKVPKEGAYYLYNEERECIASSVMLTNAESVLLPTGGYLVLAGEPGNTFEIQTDWNKGN